MDPSKSDRSIAKTAKVDHKTVATVRAEAEAGGEIPHIINRTDTKGRQQPAKKTARKPRGATKSGYRGNKNGSQHDPVAEISNLVKAAFAEMKPNEQERFLSTLGDFVREISAERRYAALDPKTAARRKGTRERVQRLRQKRRQSHSDAPNVANL